MLATTPQKRSGRWVMKSGPGWMPWITSAPSRSAVTALPGMPSDSSGIMLPPTAALLADSGPATPSIAPLPKRVGSRATRRSTAYDMKAAVTGPPPGTSPSRKPSPLPRRIGFHDARQSAAVGHSPRMRSATSVLRASVLDVGEDLGDAEEPDHDGEELDPRGQVHRPEREAVAAVDDVDADRRGEEPERDREHAFHRRAGDHVERAHEAEHHQPEVLRRAEADRDRRERRREEGQQHEARGAGDERPERRDAERRAGASLARELVAVERGHHRGRLAGDVHQDRGRRAAVHRAVEDRREHRQPGDRRERERHRQQQRERRERADPRQHADQRADEAADEAVVEVRRRQDDAEAGGEALERAHRPTSPRARAGAACRARGRRATSRRRPRRS